MKAIWCGVVACVVATAAIGQEAQVVSFSIRDGETLPLKKITLLTTNCKPVFQKLDSVDVMEDAPELSFTFKPDMVAHPTIHGKDCPNAAPGALVSVTAKGITETRDAVLTLRANIDSSTGPALYTWRVHFFLFPAKAH
jgi:hypothetical protein